MQRLGAGEGNRTLVISLEGYQQTVARQMVLTLPDNEKRTIIGIC